MGLNALGSDQTRTTPDQNRIACGWSLNITKRKAVAPMTIDLMSFMFGICVGVVPTVMAMVGAVFLDKWRNKDD